MGIADYMWDHAHGYCDIHGHYYDDRRYYPNGRFGQTAKDKEQGGNTMNEELVKIIELERKKKVKEATTNNDNDYNGTLLRNYAVTSITQPEDCADVYDVVLAPLPRPNVTARIRKQDLRQLVWAMETTAGDWYLNLDTGELSSGRGCVEQVVFAQMDGEEESHFYGIRKEEQEGDD